MKKIAKNLRQINMAQEEGEVDIYEIEEKLTVLFIHFLSNATLF
jgi:hypothetical protein